MAHYRVEDDDDYEDDYYDDEDFQEPPYVPSHPIAKQQVTKTVNQVDAESEPRKTFFHVLSNPNTNISNGMSNPKLPPNDIVMLDDIRRVVTNGDLNAFKAYIEGENGVDINIILKTNWTFLMYACIRGHHELVTYCLEMKADPNYRTAKDEQTALHIACSSDCHDEDNLLKCVESLIKYGAKVGITDSFMSTPIICCAKKARVKLITELLKHSDSNINAKDKKGMSALHWSSCSGSGQLVRILLEHGSDIMAKNSNGITAANLAQENGHETLAKILNKLDGNKIERPRMSSEDVEMIESELKERREKSQIMPASSDKNKKLIHNDHLEIFLKGLNLQDLLPKFRAHSVDFAILLTFNDENLLQMGITQVGHRKKILSSIGMTHKQNWEDKSIRNLQDESYISCPDAVNMISNIAMHLSYIDKSIIFLRHKLKKDPRILGYNKDVANVTQLYDQVNLALENTRQLFREVKCLRTDLDSIKDNVELKQADLISTQKDFLVDENERKIGSTSRCLIVSLMTFTLGFALFKFRHEIVDSINGMQIIL